MCSLTSRLLTSSLRILPKSSYSCKCRIFQPSNKRCLKNDNYSTANLFKNDNSKEKSESENDEHNLAADVAEKFQEFQDANSEIIFDVDEERKKMIDLETITAIQQQHDPYEGLNLKRGIKGVYDIEDLIQLLRKDKAQDIFVVQVPAELSYVDYVVCVTGKSMKHMNALAVFVRKVYKMKSHPYDIIPKIEGPFSKDWMALDLGNIALHIFSHKARSNYDLETLWTVGAKYDGKLTEQDVEQQFEEQYNKFLEGFQPSDR